MTENEISHKIIGVAIELHKQLGPGLLESAYENPFAYELREAGYNSLRALRIPLRPLRENNFN